MSTPEDQLRGAPEQPSEDELRAAYEAELARITTTDMIAQAVVSLLNLGARRLPSAAAGGGGSAAQAGHGASTGAADLEQARDAIDAARALLEILERRVPQELAPMRDALSQLQMAYARDARAAPSPADPASAPARETGATGRAGGEDSAASSEGAGEGPAGTDQEQSRRPGPAESSGRLWVPGR